VSGRAIVGTLIVLGVAVALAFVVAGSADGWADWVVFGVVICAVIGGAIAVWQREYPAQSKKRVFTRDSDSRW
jgi:protein-S-isoprenylcysteine O-methyltransferase Ste14